MSDNGNLNTVGAVMVVGGGIAGMQAALDLANSGFKVYIIEETPSIGGRMAQLDKTFPTNDCSTCMISPRLIEVGKHTNIEILTYSKVQAVEGTEGNFKVKVLKKARFVDMATCTGCGTCQEKCPAKTDSEFNMGLSPRKAIYTPFPQAIPNVPVIDKDLCIYFLKGKCKACEKFCLTNAINFEQQDEIVNINVGSIIAAPGFKPFDPTVIKSEYGYKRYANVITSLEYERILSASGPFEGKILRPSDGQHPKKIAWIQCIGSRDASCNREYCSAVCCMYATKQLIMTNEHDPDAKATVFYNDIRAYGKGFERYYERAKKMPDARYIWARPLIMSEMPETKNLKLKYAPDDNEISIEEFDMVILSVGLEPSESTGELADTLEIELDQYGFCKTDAIKPGRTSRAGIYVCGVFGAPMDIPESVQNASAAAFLASTPIIEARGSQITEKQYPPERDVTGEEPRIGVFVCRCGTNIARVVEVPEVVENAKTLPNVVYATEEIYACATDSTARIISMIHEHNLNRVVVASCSPRTHEPLFQDACREAGLNGFLFEMANIRDQCSWVHKEHPSEATRKSIDLVRMAVARAATLEPLKRYESSLTRTGLVIGGGLAGMTAALGLAQQGYECALIEKTSELGGNLKNIYYTLENDSDPQILLSDLKQQIDNEPRITVYKDAELKQTDGYVGNFNSIIKTRDSMVKYQHGIVIIATGALELKPEEYSYGASSNALTQLELEKAIFDKDSKVSEAETVVMIGCVGSRCEEHPYCSRICCSHAIKNASKLKEINPETDIYILHREMRTYGFSELHYIEAQNRGVKFIRFPDEKAPEVEVIKDGDKEILRVTVFDRLLSENLTIDANILALSVATVAPYEDNKNLAQILKVPMNEDNFFMEAHLKLRPLDFVVEGMYFCGLAHSPKSISETIAQANGAVSRAVTVLSQPFLMAGGIISVVDQDRCVACLTCVRSCPFSVPNIDENGFAYIEAAACRGCGICASACPRKAITVQHYSDKQVMAKTSVLYST
ncbi:FAD-dependent oxidoreductase [Chloroflexota bacterium]